MDNLKVLENLLNDEELTQAEKMYILVDNLIDCIEHDREMTHRCNLLSALWQDYNSASYRDFTKKFYCECVERVLSASPYEIEKMAKKMTISKGDNEE